MIEGLKPVSLNRGLSFLLHKIRLRKTLVENRRFIRVSGELTRKKEPFSAFMLCKPSGKRIARARRSARRKIQGLNLN